MKLQAQTDTHTHTCTHTCSGCELNRRSREAIRQQSHITCLPKHSSSSIVLPSFRHHTREVAFTSDVRLRQSPLKPLKRRRLCLSSLAPRNFIAGTGPAYYMPPEITRALEKAIKTSEMLGKLPWRPSLEMPPAETVGASTMVFSFSAVLPRLMACRWCRC